MGPEMDFLRLKNLAIRPPDVVFVASAVIEPDLETTAATGAAVEGELFDVRLKSFEGLLAARGLSFLLLEAFESAEPVRRRPKLGLRKMALPMVDLSRSVLLVPVDEEAGGKGDLVFVLLRLSNVVGAVC